MLRDLEALAIILTTTATVFGFMIRRWRASRPSANLEHMRKLQEEGREMDDILEELKRDTRRNDE